MSKPLRIAFMGSPDFAVPVVAALKDAGHDIVCVYSQPPRPSGRGKKLRSTPVHVWAEANEIEVRTPKSLKSPEEQALFSALDLDAAVVVAYGLILPKAVLEAPRLGCMNMHASLLPRWRGAAPIHRAVMAGDPETGVQAMMMEAGLDTGPVLATEKTNILPEDTTGSVHDRLAELAAGLAVRALAGLADGSITPQPQAEEGVIYAHKITAEDQRIDWRRSAAEVDAHIRGLSPFPGAWCYFGDEKSGDSLRIKVGISTRTPPETDPNRPRNEAETTPITSRNQTEPGQVMDDKLAVMCGDGETVRLLRVQKPGSKVMDADTFLRGLPIPAGSKFT